MHTAYSANHRIYFSLTFAKVTASDLQNDPTLRAYGAIANHSFDTPSMSDQVRPLIV
jgi:hypothetical protein